MGTKRTSSRPHVLTSSRPNVLTPHVLTSQGALTLTQIIVTSESTARIVKDGRVLTIVPLTVLSSIGDADIDAALERAQEMQGTPVPVSSVTRARGMRPLSAQIMPKGYVSTADLQREDLLDEAREVLRDLESERD